MMYSVFNNEPGAALNICLINAAALLYLSGTENNLEKSIETCKVVIEEKKVKQKFLDFVKFTNNI